MSAGELSDHFAVSKPTMSAHFSVLQNAGLIESEKSGRTIFYRLKMSVLEDVLLTFAHTLGWEIKSPETPEHVATNSQELHSLNEEN
jgi:DNA-binding transcriptional ArsR family regulator